MKYRICYEGKEIGIFEANSRKEAKDKLEKLIVISDKGDYLL